MWRLYTEPTAYFRKELFIPENEPILPHAIHLQTIYIWELKMIYCKRNYEIHSELAVIHIIMNHEYIY